ITAGRRAAPKGAYRLDRATLARHLAGSSCLALWLPGDAPSVAAGAWLKELLPAQVWIAVELHRDGRDRRRLTELARVGRSLGLPLVASGNVHMHDRSRRMLQDTLTAIRNNTTVDALGLALHPNAERSLRPLEELAELYPRALLDETVAILERIRFSL